MTNNHKSNSNTRSLSKQAIQCIGVKRIKEGYQLYDNYTKQILAHIWVIDGANDIVNSHLRDIVISAYYDYGKMIGCYR